MVRIKGLYPYAHAEPRMPELDLGVLMGRIQSVHNRAEPVLLGQAITMWEPPLDSNAELVPASHIARLQP